jgi:acetyl esterase/lipase
MATKKKIQRVPSRIKAYVWLCYLIIGLTFCLFVPFWVALSAGIASLSIVIFGIGTILLAILYFDPKAPKSLLLVAMASSLIGLILPQALMFSVAKKAGTPLHFNPVTYTKYSGETTLKPAQSLLYKKAHNADLRIAYYPASTSGKRPIVVLLHGGGWRFGNYLQTGKWPELLTNRGYHVVSVQYRLSSETYHTWLDAPADVHDAVTFLKQNAKELSVDTKQIHLLGQSAGGHLALLEAYRFNSVNSVMTLYAPVDLTLDYETSRDKSAELDFIGGPPAQYPQRYAALNPLSYVRSSSPRSLLIQGTRDDLVSSDSALQQSEVLASKNVPYVLVMLPLTGHSFENQNGGLATQIAEQSVMKFLNQ